MHYAVLRIYLRQITLHIKIWEIYSILFWKKFSEFLKINFTTFFDYLLFWILTYDTLIRKFGIT